MALLSEISDVKNGRIITNDASYDDYKEQRQRLERLLKEAQRNGDFDEAKDLQKEINELIKKGTKDSSDYDKKMFEKGYRYKIVLPSGMGEDLYARDFTSTKEMVKEYGTGAKTVELTKDGALSDLFGGALDPLLEETEKHAKDTKDQRRQNLFG